MKPFALFLGLVCLAGSASASRCLTYEPDVVDIKGKLARETFPARNYESIQAGDRVETYWIAVLSRPVCVTQTNKDEEIDVSYKNVRNIQLVLPDDDAYKRWRDCVGKPATVTGQLYGAHTAHHRTKVLIRVKKIHCG